MSQLPPPPPHSSTRCARLAAACPASHYLCRNMATADEDGIVQPSRSEQEEAPEQVPEVRAQQDVSECHFYILFVCTLAQVSQSC